MINSVVLQGRLTKDIELKKVGDNISTCEFTVAWSEKYKDKETKCFLRCKAWRGTADLLEKHFTKGQELVVEGGLVTEEWEKDGATQSRTILNVAKVHFCGKKSDNTAPSNVPAGFVPVYDDDDDPF
jgi:single-strand DNA-binding protein